MPDEKIDEILSVVKTLNVKLYGEGQFEGDIPEMKALLKNHSKRIRIIEIVLAGSGILGGGALGIIKLLSG